MSQITQSAPAAEAVTGSGDVLPSPLTEAECDMLALALAIGVEIVVYQ